MTKKPRVVATIEARMNATRLPGKVLLPILGRPMLSLMIERAKRAKKIDALVVATTTNKADDPIAGLAKKEGVAAFRGSEDDVLGRVIGAAKKHRADVLVRLTADCPLSDPVYIDKAVAMFLTKKWDYVANDNIVQTMPRGFDIEACSVQKLDEISRTVADPKAHEHVTTYFYQHPKRYRLGVFSPPAKWVNSKYRLTVDTGKDFELVKRIFLLLYPKNPHFSYEDVIELLRHHPEMAKINLGIQQKSVDWLQTQGEAIKKKIISGFFSYRPKYRAAIIGCGRVASEYDNDPHFKDVSSHAGAYQTHPDVKLVAGCDIDPKKREAFEKRWGVQTYDDARAMFRKEKVDIVSVTTRSDQHYQMMRIAIDAGVKAILCEKPFTADPKMAADIVRRCNKQHIALFVDFNRRFDPMHRRLKDLIEKKKFGRPLGGIAYYSNGFFNNGSHLVDVIQWFCGPVVSVRALALHQGAVEFDIDASLQFKDGGIVLMKSIPVSSYYQLELDALFDKGRIRILQQGECAELYETRSHPSVPSIKQLNVNPKTYSYGNIHTLPAVVRHIVDVLQKKEKNFSPGENGQSVVTVLKSIHRSWKQNGRVVRVV